MRKEIDYKSLKKSKKYKELFAFMDRLEKEKLNVLIFRAESIFELEKRREMLFNGCYVPSLHNENDRNGIDELEKGIEEITEMQRKLHKKLKWNITGKI